MWKTKITSAVKSLADGRHQVVVALVLLMVITGAERGYGGRLQTSAKKHHLSVRLIGRAPLLPSTSFGANYESYVAALQSPKSNNSDVPLVKLVYRFLTYDPRLPASFLDYDMVLEFRAVRQPDCDEAVEQLLGPDTFVYARNATAITVPPATILRCYVVAPADYKGSKRISAQKAAVARADVR